MAVGSGAVDAPFIGRVDELRMLRRLLDTALSGRPREVLLSGDAGVGKSRLVAEAMATASSTGVTVLFGTCYEDTGIPYLPVATAFRPLQHEGARGLNPLQGSSVASERMGDGDHRMRIFLGATAALVHTAASGPTLLVLDDVQWADEASAELIRHLVLSSMHEASVAELPLMIVLSARGPWPAGVPRALARLGRDRSAVELHVEGFGVADTHALVATLTNARPRTEVTRALLDATSGNALLVSGVISRNVAAGRLVIADGEVRLGRDGPLAASAGLDDEIRLDLAREDGPSRSVLDVAAVLGDGEQTAALRRACGEGLSACLDALFDRGILCADGPLHRFVHPQVRHVVYGDLPAEERTAMHLRVADALEASFEDTDGSTALAIANHLRRGGADPRDDRVARWARLAGDQAWASGAWDEARRAYALALDGTARGALDPPQVIELLLRAGLAAYRANDDTCLGLLDEAAALAERTGDVEHQAEALVVQARFRLIGSASTVGEAAPIADLEALLPRLEGNPSVQARILTTMSDLLFVSLDHERAADCARRAQRLLSEDISDKSATASVAFALALNELSAINLVGARALFEQVVATGDDPEVVRGGGGHLALDARARIGLAMLAQGDPATSEPELVASRQAARRFASHSGQQMATATLAEVSLLRGELADVERLANEALSLYEIQEYAFTPGMVFPMLSAARTARGDLTGALAAIYGWRSAGGRGGWRYEALLAVRAGEGDRVADELRRRRWPDPGGPNLFTLDGPCLHVAVGAALGDRALVSPALPVLAEAHRRGLVFTLGWPWLVSRLLGEGHAALGEQAAAERWYARALDESRRAGAPIEEAYVLLGQAQMLRSAGRMHEAAALGATSAARFDAVDALGPAGVASAFVNELGGLAAPPPRDRFILFTDIVGSTDLNVRAGDQGYVLLIEEHDRILRDRLRLHGGVEHAHTGDGMSAWFATADDALACAVGIHADLERASIAHSELPVRVRIGISIGQPVHTREKLFGLAVVVAARICALAGSGQVLVSEGVRTRASASRVFRPLGPHQLKGIPEPEPIHELVDLG